MRAGNYFMHDNAMDVCFYVTSVNQDGSSNGVWYNVGYTGNPWPINGDIETIWINGNWSNITNKVHIPRPNWNTEQNNA